VPSPYSIYKDVCKLPAGTILRLDCSDVQRRPEPIIYWSARRICELGVAEPFEGSEEEAVTCLQNLLRDAVRIHMESDVRLELSCRAESTLPQSWRSCRNSQHGP